MRNSSCVVLFAWSFFSPSVLPCKQFYMCLYVNACISHLSVSRCLPKLCSWQSCHTLAVSDLCFHCTQRDVVLFVMQASIRKYDCFVWLCSFVLIVTISYCIESNKWGLWIPYLLICLLQIVNQCVQHCCSVMKCAVVAWPEDARCKPHFWFCLDFTATWLTLVLNEWMKIYKRA